MCRVYCKESDYEEKTEKVQFQETPRKDRGIEDEDEIDDTAEQVTCMTLHKREPIKRGKMVPKFFLEKLLNFVFPENVGNWHFLGLVYFLGNS